MSKEPGENQGNREVDGERAGAAAGGVAEFLQAPKKKQRNYIVLAAGSNLTTDFREAVTKYLESVSKAFVLVQPKSAEDLARQMSRQIHLMVVDDSFAERPRLLKLIRFMKEKRATTGLPVLFLTRDAAGLTGDYRRELLVHQESDDFIGLKGITPAELVARIKQAIETRNRRRSRRFKVAMPITWQTLGAAAWSNCQLVDISIHGAQIAEVSSEHVFKVNTQIRLQIPLGGNVSAAEGEILRLSARVRRVSVGGGRAGISFEHLTDRQVLSLTQLITSLAGAQSTSSLVDNTFLRVVE